MPSVFAAASASTLIVIAAPAMLTVAPTGIVTAYSSSLTPSFFASARFTGMLAAELRVKNAVMPDSSRHRSTIGYGLRRVTTKTMRGFTTSAISNMVPTSNAARLA